MFEKKIGVVEIGRDSAFGLDTGKTLSQLVLSYATYRSTEETSGNWILIFHGLSGSHNVDEWWPIALQEEFGVLNKGDQIICFNSLGSCWGSSGPASIDPTTGQPFGCNFPVISIDDSVNAVVMALKKLGIVKLKAAVGMSFGGMQALSLARQHPDLASKICAIASCPLSPLPRTMMTIQRALVEFDGITVGSIHSKRGLMLARALQFCTCISFEGATIDFPNDLISENLNLSDTASGYHGKDIFEKCENFSKRFDSTSFVRLTHAVETFSLEKFEYRNYQPKILMIGIDSDLLNPVCDIEACAKRLNEKNCDVTLNLVSSKYGHISWLQEPYKFANLVGKFINHEDI